MSREKLLLNAKSIKVIKVQTKPQVSYLSTAAVSSNFFSTESKEIIVSKLANFTFTLTLDNKSY